MNHSPQIDVHPDGSHTLIHVSCDIQWMLTDWTGPQLARSLTRADGTRLTPDEARAALLGLIKNGHKLIPLGDPCEGWSSKTGCPGHKVKPFAEKTAAEIIAEVAPLVPSDVENATTAVVQESSMQHTHTEGTNV